MNLLTSSAKELQRIKSVRAIRLLISKNLDKRRDTARKIRRSTQATRRQRRLNFLAPTRIRYYVSRELRLEFEEFAGHIEKMLGQGTQVTIDFRPTIQLVPCGVLLLMGLVDSWIERFPGKLTARYPLNDLVEQMLQQVGVLQKLGLEARKEISHADVKRWHYFTGKNVQADKMDPFMDELASIISNEAQQGLFACVTEAMTNVKHHAYGQGTEGGPWWMFATISENRVFVAMYDRGATIPSTLLAKPEFSDLLTGKIFKIRKNRDAKLILAAVGGRTSTRQSYRGKGLSEMLTFTSSLPSSSLGIYSRKGFFGFNNGHKQPESSGYLDWPVDGTLILWMINLSGDN